MQRGPKLSPAVTHLEERELHLELLLFSASFFLSTSASPKDDFLKTNKPTNPQPNPNPNQIMSYQTQTNPQMKMKKLKQTINISELRDSCKKLLGAGFPKHHFWCPSVLFHSFFYIY